jgi:hypothetical protein
VVQFRATEVVTSSPMILFYRPSTLAAAAFATTPPFDWTSSLFSLQRVTSGAFRLSGQRK